MSKDKHPSIEALAESFAYLSLITHDLDEGIYSKRENKDTIYEHYRELFHHMQTIADAVDNMKSNLGIIDEYIKSQKDVIDNKAKHIAYLAAVLNNKDGVIKQLSDRSVDLSRHIDMMDRMLPAKGYKSVESNINSCQDRRIKEAVPMHDSSIDARIERDSDMEYIKKLVSGYNELGDVG